MEAVLQTALPRLLQEHSDMDPKISPKTSPPLTPFLYRCRI